MKKIKEIKTWRIKEEFLKNAGGVPRLIFCAVGESLETFGNINQAVGAICNAGLEMHLQTLFEVYATYGIWLAENDAVEINFKPKKKEKSIPGYTG